LFTEKAKIRGISLLYWLRYECVSKNI